MIDAALRELLQQIALPGYGYPEHLLIWRERLDRQHHLAVIDWADREGHPYVAVLAPDGYPRGYWLVPRTALA